MTYYIFRSVFHFRTSARKQREWQRPPTMAVHDNSFCSVGNGNLCQKSWDKPICSTGELGDPRIQLGTTSGGVTSESHLSATNKYTTNISKEQTNRNSQTCQVSQFEQLTKANASLHSGPYKARQSLLQDYIVMASWVDFHN